MAVRSALAGTLLLWLLLAFPAHAEWTVSSAEAGKGAVPGLERRHVVVSDSATGGEARLDFAVFSTKTVAVRVIDAPDGEDLANVARRLRAAAGVNGGYFDPQNAPVGLLISDGKPIAPFRKAKLLSGVLVVIKGKVELVRSAEYSTRKNVIAALQCGPFLVDNGGAVAGLNNTRPARRTFVLTMGPDRAAIGFCSAVTLAELADILATPKLIPEAKVQRALNLDGGSSSAFWFAGDDSAFSIAEQKTVRNFVIVTPK
jgi:exopolysaccharide biosynthesis protein